MAFLMYTIPSSHCWSTMEYWTTTMKCTFELDTTCTCRESTETCVSLSTSGTTRGSGLHGTCPRIKYLCGDVFNYSHKISRVFKGLLVQMSSQQREQRDHQHLLSTDQRGLKFPLISLFLSLVAFKNSSNESTLWRVQETVLESIFWRKC
ncbi:hypothetical protein SKAU_G00244740 [Synaphobranchus kaupii]|uniref:Uncharacterized protein n=1 Tax=Synaphobranchus kaupii TaxID=118154 RepID=A0A9Q1F1N7_SYNKA|nr:hypothetical protein SKAU_G00244740 [Synaphobranchus kaupii]